MFSFCTGPCESCPPCCCPRPKPGQRPAGSPGSALPLSSCVGGGRGCVRAWGLPSLLGRPPSRIITWGAESLTPRWAPGPGVSRGRGSPGCLREQGTECLQGGQGLFRTMSEPGPHPAKCGFPGSEAQSGQVAHRHWSVGAAPEPRGQSGRPFRRRARRADIPVLVRTAWGPEPDASRRGDA